MSCLSLQNFKYGVRFAENFVFNSQGRSQVVEDAGIRISQFDLHVYNDINMFPFGGDNDDRFNSGGAALRYNTGGEVLCRCRMMFIQANHLTI